MIGNYVEVKNNYSIFKTVDKCDHFENANIRIIFY